jgi:hypothetical protein
MKPQCLYCGKTHYNLESAEYATKYGCSECGSTDVDWGGIQSEFSDLRVPSANSKRRYSVIASGQFTDWSNAFRKLKGGDKHE